LLLIVFYRSATGVKGPFTDTDKKFGLYAMIVCDIMLLTGLYQWIAGNWGLHSIQNDGMKQVMTNPTLRFYAIEHTTGMLIAIVLVHIGRTYSKKNIPDSSKHKRTLLFFGLALLIILVSLPWPFREVGAGRGWF
ncbi:MAG TPA: hypothetical protein VET23_15980, partial [Chitinophagaceae bacterium]|nr:hypothetical protein [Chitinophagaceae bacterium]